MPSVVCARLEPHRYVRSRDGLVAVPTKVYRSASVQVHLFDSFIPSVSPAVLLRATASLLAGFTECPHIQWAADAYRRLVILPVRLAQMRMPTVPKTDRFSCLAARRASRSSRRTVSAST